MKLRTAGILLNSFGVFLGLTGMFAASTPSQQFVPAMVVFVNCLLLWLWHAEKD